MEILRVKSHRETPPKRRNRDHDRGARTEAQAGRVDANEFAKVLTPPKIHQVPDYLPGQRRKMKLCLTYHTLEAHHTSLMMTALQSIAEWHYGIGVR